MSLFVSAKLRHAKLRALAYQVAAEAAVEEGICTPGLRIADIDAATLDVWRTTWVGPHPSGDAIWDWDEKLRMMRRRAAVIPMAVWHNADLCGLARGYLTRARLSGRRNAVVIELIESKPQPHPLRGNIVEIVLTAAEIYGAEKGAGVLRLMHPKQALVKYYRDEFDFRVVYSGQTPHYCERTIQS